MITEPIRNDEDLQRAFRRLESFFQAEEDSAQARERGVLVTLIEDYETEHHGFGTLTVATFEHQARQQLTEAVDDCGRK